MTLDTEGQAGESPVMSKSEIAAGVQAAFELCATCAHNRADHDGPCIVTWYAEGSQKACECEEFWPAVREREGRFPVTGWAVAFGGSTEVGRRRRSEEEFWSSLQPGDLIEVRGRFEVEGRGFKPERVEGFIVGQIETRKLSARGLVIERVDRATGEVR